MNKALTAEEEAARLAAIAAEDPRARRARYERELAAEIAKGPEAAPLQPAADDGEPIAAVSARVLAQIQRQTAERMLLPCYRAMYPDGQAPAADEDRVDDLVGKAACDAAKAHAGCSVAGTPFCPRAKVVALRDEVSQRLAKARVPREEAALILRALDASGSVPLQPLDTLRVVRAVLQHKRLRVPLDNAVEVLAAEQRRHLLLQGTERLLVLGGNRGRGKTVAAEYLLARVGGLYLCEPALGRPAKDGGANVAEAIAARALVIDQLGRANRGGTDFAPAQIEEVVDARCAAGLLTVLVGNFGFPEFTQRYGEIVLDRVWGYGAFLLFGGDSLRPALRQ